MITLEDFVSETLIQIIKGVKKAQEGAIKLGAVISPQNERFRRNTFVEMSQGVKPTKEKVGQFTREVNFDIAITASEENQAKVGLGVFVLGIGVGGKGQSQNAALSEFLCQSRRARYLLVSSGIYFSNIIAK